LPGGDGPGRPAEDVRSDDGTLERALGRRAGRLVAAAAQERAHSTGHAGLPEVDVREEGVALAGLEALLMEPVVDRVPVHDLGPERPAAGRRLRRSLFVPGQACGEPRSSVPTMASVCEC